MLVKVARCMTWTVNRVWLPIKARYGLQTTGGSFGLGSTVWIGATDEAVEGSFVWLPAGNPVNFEAWDLGQPDNLDSLVGQDCATYVPGRKLWHDFQCSFALEMFICEGWGHMASSFAEDFMLKNGMSSNLEWLFWAIKNDIETVSSADWFMFRIFNALCRLSYSDIKYVMKKIVLCKSLLYKFIMLFIPRGCFTYIV